MKYYAQKNKKLLLRDNNHSDYYIKQSQDKYGSDELNPPISLGMFRIT